jgi:HAD superfamily hydrolase (TIGR01549 family)
VTSSDGIRALVFDLDGTLYRHAPLRRAMAARMLLAFCRRPLDGSQALRAVSAYRRAQEQIRGESCQIASHDLSARQLQFAARNSGLAEEAVLRHVRRWMEEAPLPLLGRFERAGLRSLLDRASARGLRLGLFSDYPPEAKLAALGAAEYFSVVSCAQSPEVGRFKPDPAGILFVARRLGVTPDQTLYVGDRPDIDWPAARAADMRCAIIGVSGKKTARDYAEFKEFGEVEAWLFGA